MKLLIERLVKSYAGGARAVDDVSLEVRDGEFLVLLGPSGCGKTTTMRCVAGFEQPDSGRIVLDGRVVTSPAEAIHVAPEQRNVGMVFQSYAIWPHMTVFDNVVFPLGFRKVSRAEAAERVRETLALVGLAGLEDRPATHLSGGQMQRVALARALVYRPSVLLLDEPLSNLDAKLRLRLRFELKEIQRRTGITAMYVTHDQSEAVVLGDRIAVLDSGRLVQIGTPDDIFNRPANGFVARFVGDANIFSAQVLGAENGGVVVKVGDLRMLAATAPAAAAGEGYAVSLRPENLRLGRTAPADVNCWQGTLRRVEFLGTQCQYAVALPGLELSAVVLGSTVEFQPGEQVFVHAPPERVLVFPA